MQTCFMRQCKEHQGIKNRCKHATCNASVISISKWTEERFMQVADTPRRDINVPAYTNHCGHPLSEFICSYKCDEKLYDLYIFDCFESRNVCIRFGEEPNFYYGAGPLHTFLSSRYSLPTYIKAQQICRCWLKLENLAG